MLALPSTIRALSSTEVIAVPCCNIVAIFLRRCHSLRESFGSIASYILAFFEGSNRIVPAGMISIRCSLVLSDATAPTSLGFGSVIESFELVSPTLFTTPAKSAFVNHIFSKRGDVLFEAKISLNRFFVAAGDSFMVIPA